MILLSGLLSGLGLIVAIGAQNAFILRQGIRKDGVTLVVLTCILSDVILIWPGAVGLSRLLASADWLIEVMRWLGAAYLLYFAYRSARSAFQDNSLQPEEPNSARRSILLTTLALTWLNPHVYLDTVVLLGGLANNHGDAWWQFSLGATLGSAVWFSALGFGARLLAPYLQKAVVWKVIDMCIAVVMVLIAAALIFS